MTPKAAATAGLLVNDEEDLTIQEAATVGFTFRTASTAPPRRCCAGSAWASRKAQLEAFHRGDHGYRAAKRVEFRGADPVRRREGNIPALEWLSDEEPRAVGDLTHVEKSFAPQAFAIVLNCRDRPIADETELRFAITNDRYPNHELRELSPD